MSCDRTVGSCHRGVRLREGSLLASRPLPKQRSAGRGVAAGAAGRPSGEDLQQPRPPPTSVGAPAAMGCVLVHVAAASPRSAARSVFARRSPADERALEEARRHLAGARLKEDAEMAARPGSSARRGREPGQLTGASAAAVGQAGDGQLADQFGRDRAERFGDGVVARLRRRLRSAAAKSRPRCTRRRSRARGDRGSRPCWSRRPPMTATPGRHLGGRGRLEVGAAATADEGTELDEQWGCRRADERRRQLARRRCSSRFAAAATRRLRQLRRGPLRSSRRPARSLSRVQAVGVLQQRSSKRRSSGAQPLAPTTCAMIQRRGIRVWGRSSPTSSRTAGGGVDHAATGSNSCGTRCRRPRPLGAPRAPGRRRARTTESGSVSKAGHGRSGQDRANANPAVPR